jgi:hypothetical protein
VFDREEGSQGIYRVIEDEYSIIVYMAKSGFGLGVGNQFACLPQAGFEVKGVRLKV